jgi:hypothetical protein
MLQKRGRYVPFFMILSISSPFFKQMSFYIENPMSDRDDINTMKLSNQDVLDFKIWYKKTIAFKKSHILASMLIKKVHLHRKVLNFKISWQILIKNILTYDFNIIS